MSGPTHRVVGPDEGDQRLDRWFKRHYPALGHGRLSKLLRTGQVRVDGARVEAGTRLEAGQSVRIPPLSDAAEASTPAPRRTPSERDVAALRGMIIHQDDDVIALDKPAGLAVQGGQRITTHIDGMLDALARKGERPRLVHRLDRDTSGILVLARNAAAARALTEAFRTGTARKRYDALVVGTPERASGRISAPLVKSAHGKGRVATDEEEEGKRAVTLYEVVDRAHRRASWLALYPQTGRTHQLRIHCVAIGTPILGDGKYGGREAFLPGAGLAAQLHLHARRIVLPHPAGGVLDLAAPLSPHMTASFDYFGFDRSLPPEMAE